MVGIPASLLLWDICHLYCSWSPADLVTRVQLFSYQPNDTISPIGIAEHCSFIQLWWYDLANRLGRGASDTKGFNCSPRRPRERCNLALEDMIAIALYHKIGKCLR